MSSYPDLTEANVDWPFGPSDELSVYSLAQGTFAGMSISSCTLNLRAGLNEWIYGVRQQRDVDLSEIISWSKVRASGLRTT